MWYFKWRQLWAALSLMVFVGGSYSGNAGIPEKDPEFELEIEFIEILLVHQMTEWIPLQIKQLKETYSDNLYGLQYVDARFVTAEADRIEQLEKTPPESSYYFDALFYVAMYTESVEKKYDILHRLLVERRFSTQQEQSLLFNAYFSPNKRHPAYAKGVAAAEKQWAEDKGKHPVQGTDKAVEVKNEISTYVRLSTHRAMGGKIDHERINYSAGYKARIKQLLLKHIAEKPKVAP